MKTWACRISNSFLTLALFLLAGATSLTAAPFFNVLAFGAHNDGSASSTEAFRSAIQAASAAGGGSVYVPAGHYVTGPIVLTNNLVLDFAAGAVVRFPARRLPFTQGREQGIECLTPVPLIGGRNLHNVTIAGRGVLTTDNAAWLKIMPRTNFSKTNIGTAFGPHWEHLLNDLKIKTPASAEDYQKAAPELRPSFVRFMDCTNVFWSKASILLVLPCGPFISSTQTMPWFATSSSKPIPACTPTALPWTPAITSAFLIVTLIQVTTELF